MSSYSEEQKFAPLVDSLKEHSQTSSRHTNDLKLKLIQTHDEHYHQYLISVKTPSIITQPYYLLITDIPQLKVMNMIVATSVKQIQAFQDQHGINSRFIILLNQFNQSIIESLKYYPFVLFFKKYENDEEKFLLKQNIHQSIYQVDQFQIEEIIQFSQKQLSTLYYCQLEIQIKRNSKNQSYYQSAEHPLLQTNGGIQQTLLFSQSKVDLNNKFNFPLQQVKEINYKIPFLPTNHRIFLPCEIQVKDQLKNGDSLGTINIMIGSTGISKQLTCISDKNPLQTKICTIYYFILNQLYEFNKRLIFSEEFYSIKNSQEFQQLKDPHYFQHLKEFQEFKQKIGDNELLDQLSNIFIEIQSSQSLSLSQKILKFGELNRNILFRIPTYYYQNLLRV